MKKRIYLSMMLITVISIVLVSTALYLVFNGQFLNVISEDPQEYAEMFIFDSPLSIVISVAVAMLLIGHLLARILAKRIVAPINSVDFSAEISVPYDELAPFIRTIEHQRDYITQQLADLQKRADTTGAIMDNMSEGIIFIGKQGVILSVNKSALSIFEAQSSMVGKNILELIRNVELLQNVRNAILGKRGEMSLEQSGKTFSVFFSPVMDSGVIILFLDITEKIMSEKMRREFSANVSHELKTPLTSIYGHAEMLSSGMVREADRHEFYSKIKDESARLISLIEDIIMISELDEGRGHEPFEDVDIAAVCAETVESLSLKAMENKVSVNVSGKGVLRANRSMMYELFYNLIDNAIKYNRPNGTVKIDISQTEDHTAISIADTGIGISKEAQSRVFERFYRVDKSRSKKTGGTGLGLAIVKHIVMVHGGRIDLISKKDEGTTVVLGFPPG